MNKKNFIFWQGNTSEGKEVIINSNFNLKNYTKVSGERQVLLVLTSGGKRKRISLDIFVKSKDWDSNKQRVKKKGINSTKINLLLDAIKARVSDIKVRYQLQNEILTLDKLYDEYKSKSPEFDFISFCNYHIEKKDMKAGSKKKELSHIKKLADFTANQELLFSTITIEYMDKYRNYLYNEKKNKHSTINANFKTIKKYLALAQKYGNRLNIDPNLLEVKNINGYKVNLDIQELKKLKEYYYSSFIKEKHKLPLGYFLCACFTSCRLNELKKIKREDIDGKNILNFLSDKTGKHQGIQINKSFRDVVNHNENLFKKFISDQKLNEYIKECASVCGIKKNLSMHVGRHTFATNYLRLGGKVEDLQLILNHGSIETTMGYVKQLKAEEIDDIKLFDAI